MSPVPTVRLRIYPDDCDAYGHVNQAAFLRMVERARWEAIPLGPGTDVFTRAAAWPAIRRASVEYYEPAFPGELLRFDLVLTHLGRTSFSMHQTVRREAGGAIIAAGQFVGVCIDHHGRPTPIPEAMTQFLGVRPSTPGGEVRHFVVRGAATAVDVEGDGQAVLFVHGFPFDRTMWRAQLTNLGGFSRIAPDLRGFGLTDPPPERWTLADYADDLVWILDQVGVERTVVCGLSMGGYIAFELWRRHRKRICGLILASTRPEPDTAEGKKRRDEMIELVRRSGPGAVVDAMLPKLLAPATLDGQPQIAAHVRTMIADSSASGMMSAIVAMRERSDSTPLLSSIDVPTLVVAGAADALIPADAQRALAHAITNAQFESVPDAGHLAPLEQPDRFNRTVAAFLNSMR